MLFTVPFDDFGGLNLADAPNENSGALDLLNVEFDRPGRVRTRDGFALVSNPTHNPGPTFSLLMPLIKAASNQTSPSYSVYTIGGSGTSYGVVNALTGADATAPGTTGIPVQGNYTQFGTPAADFLYFAGDSSAGARGATTSRTTVQKWDGTTLSAGVGKPFYVATTPWDNRLVEAGFDTAAGSPTGASGSQSTVFFSDPGLPDTFSANNYVTLHPGDGERITGVCVWRDKLIVLKETRMFVFYGTSTDSTGNPVFNYRTVDIPFRVPEMLSRVIVAGQDAFYFYTDGGVFTSTGGPPTLISEAINRALIGPIPSTWTDYATVPQILGMSFAAGRVWVHIYNAGVSLRSFVLNLKTGQWTYSSIGSHVLSNADGTGVYFIGSSFDNQTGGAIYLTSLTATTDAGAAITSRYRSPFIPLDWRGRNLRSGIHGVDKTVRESLVEGTGTVSYALTNQWATTIPTPAALTLGTSPAVAEARDRRSVRGRMFSFQLSGTSPWEVQTVSWNVYGYQAAGEQSEVA